MRRRPSDIDTPGPGQESVWDYPRPPRLESVPRPLTVVAAGVTIAETGVGKRVCETASPPTYYFPPEDVRTDLLEPSSRRTFCEWKGTAVYWTLRIAGTVVVDAAWSYLEPTAPFADLRGWFAFYPARMDACRVGDWPVTPQPGRFYGGWVTPNLTGPFKGEPGTEFW